MATSRPPISDEAIEQFLLLVRDGMHPYDAARRVPGPVKRTEAELARDPRIPEEHESASRFRRMMKRGLLEGAKERDRQFAHDYIDALAQFDDETDERLEAEYLRRGLDPEVGGNGSSNRMLHQYVLTRSARRDTRLSPFLPLLEARTRHVHEGSVGHYPMIDVSKLSDEELEQLAAITRKAGTSPPPATNGRAPLALEPGPPAADNVAS